MRVFISWSGSRSRYIAETLRNWLPKVLQAAKPWMSEEDIAAGTRWFSEIGNELSNTKVGIICLTPENQHNPWVMFEAGAVSKTISEAFVCPYLFDLNPSQLSGPMTQFQAVSSDYDGTFKVLQMLNKSLSDAQIPVQQLEEIYEVWWPKLEDKLKNTPNIDNKIQKRPYEDIIDEILNNTREQLRRENVRLQSFQYKDDKLDNFLLKFSSFFTQLEQIQEQSRRLTLEGMPTTVSDEQKFHPTFPNIPGIFGDLKDLSDENKNLTKELLGTSKKNSKE